jgi:hypothetical protein
MSRSVNADGGAVNHIIGVVGVCTIYLSAIIKLLESYCMKE